MPKPNLFDYATKELSQDAVICWLIEWSRTPVQNEVGQALRELGRAFVEALLAKHRASLTGDVRPADIYRQNLGIDVLARVQDQKTAHVFVIEDKTYTDQHSRQLQRYFENVMKGESKLGDVHKSSVRPMFLKTGNQSLRKDRRIERETGYRVFGRKDFLDVLERYRGEHPIVIDFREHLRRLEKTFTGYRRWSRNDNRRDWSWNAWEGIFRCFEGRLDADLNADWGYVPNPKGGFLGFWWDGVTTTAGDSLYLQLEIEPGNPEKQKLCFKVAQGEDGTVGMRDKYHNALLAEGAGRIERPSRMGRGRTMTVGVWTGDWIEFGADDRLDIDRTISNLRQAKCIIESAAGDRGMPSQ